MPTRTVKILAAMLLAAVFLLCASCADEATPAFEKRGNVVVLLYHTLTPDAPSEGFGVTTSAEKFTSDLETLLALGYEPISLTDMYNGKAEAGKLYFAVTFDDGYLTNYEIAFPILQQYGCYADIFINTDNEHMAHHFSFAQAAEMEASGFVKIHSHFPVHEDVRDYSDDEFARELKRSVDTLETELGERKAVFFAYPYGACNEAKYERAKAEGVMLQFVQEPQPEGDDYIVRMTVSFDTDIAALLETAYFN